MTDSHLCEVLRVSTTKLSPDIPAILQSKDSITAPTESNVLHIIGKASLLGNEDKTYTALPEFGQRISNDGLQNVSRSFYTKGLVRDKRLISPHQQSDPMEHMLSMFHSALQLAQVDDILNRAVNLEFEPESQIIAKSRAKRPFKKIISALNRAGESNEFVDAKTPPTPTARAQFGQKRILTGRRRNQFKSNNNRVGISVPQSTPAVRTLPPQQIRFTHHLTTTVRPLPNTTPITVKRLPSFKPQNIPTRQRIRVKIPRNTTLPFIRQPLTSPSTNRPSQPLRNFSQVPFTVLNEINQNKNVRFPSSTPFISAIQSSTPFVRPPVVSQSTPRPFIGSQSLDANLIKSNELKSLRLTPSTLNKDKHRRPLTSLRSEIGTLSQLRQPITRKPSNQFQKFKIKSSIKLPDKSAIKSLSSHTGKNLQRQRRPPSSSSYLPERNKPFKPSPKIIEGNFVPSTQGWTTKPSRSKLSKKIESRRRPPVVPRVPIVPKTKIPKFLHANIVSNSVSEFRKGKKINDGSGITSNEELLSLFSTSTEFQCNNQEYPGLYADLETNCQTFHMCQVGGRQNTFICPVGTLFDQRYLVCNWSNRVDCRRSVEYYSINRKIYEPSV